MAAHALQDAHLSGGGGEDLEGLVQLLAGMLTGHDDADAGLAFGNGGECDAGGHKALFEEGLGEVHGAAAVSDDDGDDGRFRGGGGVSADVEARGGELLLEVVGVGPEALDAFGLVLKNVEGCDAGGGDGRRMRGGEEEGARAVVEKVDQVA
jgi:hypothetical protein